MNHLSWLASASAALLVSWCGVAAAQTRTDAAPIREIAATKDVLKSLRGGGYVIYMRHADTDTSKPDAVPKVDLNDCGTQRNLNAEGRKAAAAIGRHIRNAHIPVGEVIYSPFCRTRETAQLAFGGGSTRLREEPLIGYPSNMTAEEKKPVLAMSRELLSAPVAPGTNRVIVGHTQNVAELIEFFVKPEGAIAVFRPQGAGRFEYVASILPNAWAELLK